MPADDSLTLPAPKISERNAIEIIEIEEWVLGAILATAIGMVERFDQLPLIGARTSSTGLEQSASGYAIGPNESCFQVWRERLVKDRVSESLDARI